MPAWGICKCHRQQLLEKHSLEKAGNHWCGDVPPAGHVQTCNWNKTSDGCCSHRHPRSKTSDLFLLEFYVFFQQDDPHLLMTQCSLQDICLQLLRDKKQITEATAGSDLVKKCINGLLSGTSMDRIALVDGFGYDAFPALSTLEARFFVSGIGDMLAVKMQFTLCLELVGIMPIQQQWIATSKTISLKAVHTPQQSSPCLLGKRFMSQARFQTHAAYGLGSWDLKTSCDRNL